MPIESSAVQHLDRIHRPLITRQLDEVDLARIHAEALLEGWTPGAPAAASPLPVADGPYHAYGKRLFDIAFSSAVLLLLGSWLFPLIALVVRLDSKGPALFRQLRVGQGGVLFCCWKFRTMTCSQDTRFVQAQKNDPRVTRVGAFLRRTNLDELPQFFNVWCGQMSVIGPRPHVPDLDEMFGDRVPGYTLRHTVKPGVSGLAQVSGCRGETRSVREMKHRIRFDVFYSRNFSLRLDVKLVVLTVFAALAGDRRAY